jgi:RNA polymerase sigma factor (sigma-70 family)
MADRIDTNIEGAEPRRNGTVMAASDVNDWFVREVLPLETMLMQFLRRGRHNSADLKDLCQDVYVRVYEAAQKEMPVPAKAFVFATARNLLIDRVRKENVVSIEAMADLDTLGIALDEPGPDRSAIARQELRRLQAALDQLPPRQREAVLMRKIEGLSRPEIAARMGIAEATVSVHLGVGMATLADFFHSEAAETGGKP